MKKGRGFVGAALLGVLLCSGAASAQVQGPQLGGVATPVASPSSLDRLTFGHPAIERWRRVDAFRREWDGANEEMRSLVAETLQELRSTGAPSEWWPDLGSIEAATRVMKGLPKDSFLAENKAGALAVQAAALDLRVLPGAFEARSEGRTPSLIVRVSPLFELREALDVQVSLIWIGPNGSEVLARSEVIGARAFTAPGFDMYVRAPHTGPSVWKLVAELAPAPGVSLEELQDDQTGAVDFDTRGSGAMLLNAVRSYPVLVPALVDPSGELARERGLQAMLNSELEESSPLLLGEVNRPRIVVDRLLAEGLRVSPYAGLSFEQYWEGRLGTAEENWAARKGLRKPAQTEVGDGAYQFLRVTPTSQIGADLRSGFAYAKWAQLGEIHDVIPSKDGIAGTIGSALADLQSAALDASLDPKTARPRVLVLRGDSLMAAQLEGLRHGQVTAEYLVIVANSWRPTPIFPTVPTLFLTPNEAVGALAAKAAHVTSKSLSSSVFLSELEVPGMIAEWLTELEASARDADSK